MTPTPTFGLVWLLLVLFGEDEAAAVVKSLLICRGNLVVLREFVVAHESARAAKNEGLGQSITADD